MATTIHCDIVSAEKEIFSGRITMISATGTLGELGILPGVKTHLRLNLR